MEKVIYNGSSESLKTIKELLDKGKGKIKQCKDNIIIYTREETRLVRKGEFIVINQGKLM